MNALQSCPLVAWGGIVGAKLDPPQKVIVARKLEMHYAEKKPVWQKVKRGLAKEEGRGMVKSRWIDINKGDDDRPNNRSRMVGKEFNDKVLDGLFAATPPFEALRMLISW